MAYRNSTSAGGGATTTVTVAVPAGAATDDIAILAISTDIGITQTITWPSGFTQLDDTLISGPDAQVYASAWKRLTGADSGNYVATLSSSTNDHLAECALFSGRHTTNAPVASTLATNTTANTSPISVTANGVTAVAGDDLLWIGAADVTSGGGGTSWSPPSSFTERQDDVNQGPGGGWCNGSMATQDNVGAGATGTITGTFVATVTAGWFASLIRIPAAAGGGGDVLQGAQQRFFM